MITKDQIADAALRMSRKRDDHTQEYMELNDLCARYDRQRVVKPCPCECNSGGFCGGCGHAGCSGGINVRRAR